MINFIISWKISNVYCYSVMGYSWRCWGGTRLTAAREVLYQIPIVQQLLILRKNFQTSVKPPTKTNKYTVPFYFFVCFVCLFFVEFSECDKGVTGQAIANNILQHFTK